MRLSPVPIAMLTIAMLVALARCGPSETAATGTWTGAIDTLSSGQVVVANTEQPIWPDGTEWRIVEDLRIGTVEGDGPDLFGRITSLEVDPAGRIYVMDIQSQELRVFNADGSYLRTIGRKGGGPGEFAQVTHVQFGPDGNLWTVDPENNRVSVFDTAGTFLDSRTSPGGFVIFPWPGGFDAAGYYYSPIPQPVRGFIRIKLVRYDREFTPIDTLAVPRDPVERERFELRRGDSFMMAGIPFSPGFSWRLAPSGTLWGMLTGEYRLFQLSLDGDTLLTITRAFTPIPVTEADRESARERLEWFTRQGGKADWSKIPPTKPATEEFFFDDAGNLWVIPVSRTGNDHRTLDVFDPAGRFLGTVDLPFPLSSQPYPLVRGDQVYAVTTDELDVPYVVRATIEKP